MFYLKNYCSQVQKFEKIACDKLMINFLAQELIKMYILKGTLSQKSM